MRGPLDLRRVSVALIAALLAEFVLGLAASLWVTIGPVRPWSNLGNPGLLAVHGVLGVALVMMALVVLSRSVEQSASVRLWATAALGSLLVSLVCGLEFVSSSGGAGWSFAMGVGWAVALFAYVRLALVGLPAGQ